MVLLSLFLILLCCCSSSLGGGVIVSSSTPPAHTKQYYKVGARYYYELDEAATISSVDWVDNIIPIEVATIGWNLDRIDGQYDGVFNRTSPTGIGVDIYVMDTGVRATESCFQGRVMPGYNAFARTGPGNVDCNSHGTHVASTAAGTTFGVATDAIIIPVIILGCNGVGNSMDFIAGSSWISGEMKKRKGRKAIINMSFTADRNDIMNDVLSQLSNEGAALVASAGNKYGRDACDFSPASSPHVIAVGATKLENDTVSDFSNIGPCVSIYAPGEHILGAGGYKTGTSMSSPLVAGVLATYWQQYPKAGFLRDQTVYLPLPFLYSKIASGNNNNTTTTTTRTVPRIIPFNLSWPIVRLYYHGGSVLTFVAHTNRVGLANGKIREFKQTLTPTSELRLIRTPTRIEIRVKRSNGWRLLFSRRKKQQPRNYGLQSA